MGNSHTARDGTGDRSSTDGTDQRPRTDGTDDGSVVVDTGDGPAVGGSRDGLPPADPDGRQREAAVTVRPTHSAGRHVDLLSRLHALDGRLEFPTISLAYEFKAYLNDGFGRRRYYLSPDRHGPSTLLLKRQ